jgi:hypothetical protein
MKKRLVFCLLLALGLIWGGSRVWAIDVGWMQKGVRVWYFGGVSTGFSSDAEEAYLFKAVDGGNVQVTKHSGMNHWDTTNPIDTSTYSFLDKGPCWIHPQTLQNLQSGNTWQGQTISTVMPGSFTYDTFLNEFPSFPYLLLPIKALFDLKSQRNLVKIVYYIQDVLTGIAYFDAETGLLLLRETSAGSVTTFFILSEINYDFANQKAFAEDSGPHTGFKSTAQETTSAIQYVQIQSLVETRYGATVQMWAITSAGGGSGSYTPPYENYCFFGSEPVLRRKYMTATPNYPPEQWNEYGEYLWWWVPAEALADSTINIFDVSMARTSTAPYTYTASESGAGLYFSKIIFDNDGYMTSFYAKDPSINLDLTLGTMTPQNTVGGLEYYRNTMGIAIPDAIADGLALEPRYRLYNPNIFHHHYTTDANEYSVLGTLGWVQEGISCHLYNGTHQIEGTQTVPYYRLYNPNSYEHHWTTDANEYDVLGTIGWMQEGADGYVFATQVTGSEPLYRLYNPNDGLHHWTMDANECRVLIGYGFIDEGIACYVFP